MPISTRPVGVAAVVTISSRSAVVIAVGGYRGTGLSSRTAANAVRL